MSLGKAVHAIVFDDVGHVNAAADGMRELAQADRSAIAIARDAEIDKILRRDIGAGEHGGHTAVDGVEAMGGANEIIRRLRRAAYAGELGQAVRGEVNFETSLDDRGAN